MDGSDRVHERDTHESREETAKISKATVLVYEYAPGG